MRKKLFLLLALGIMISAVYAIPDLEVEPSEVNRTGNESLLSGQENRINLTFVNNDSSDKIFEVDPRSSDFIDNESVSVKFNESGFNISAGENKTVESIIETDEPINFSDSSSVIYEYNTSEGRKTNSSMFPDLSFDIETRYERTNISLNPLRTDFEADLDENITSTFEIENLENQKAFSVKIEGNNSSFEKSDFNIDGSENSLVGYNLSIPKPDENPTNATNQTYTRNITVSGDNFDSKTFQVDVFVPFFDYLEDDKMDQEQLIEDLKELRNLQGLERVEVFCSRDGNEELPLCGGEIVKYNNNTEVVEKSPEFNDLSTEEILELTNATDVDPEEYRNLKNRVNVLQNNVNELKSSVNGDLGQLNETQRERYDRIQEVLEEQNNLTNQSIQAENERKDFETTVFYGFLVIAFISLGSLGAVKGYKYVRGDEIPEVVE